MHLLRLIASTALVAGLVMAGPAARAGENDCVISISPTRQQPGGAITITGTYWTAVEGPELIVRVEPGSEPSPGYEPVAPDGQETTFSSDQIDADGNWQTQVTLPANGAAGPWTMTVFLPASECFHSVPLAVDAAAAPLLPNTAAQPSTPMPTTGIGVIVAVLSALAAFRYALDQ